MTYHRVCYRSNTIGVTDAARMLYPSGALEFIPGYSGFRVAQSLVFCVMLFRSLFVLCSFSFATLSSRDNIAGYVSLHLDNKLCHMSKYMPLPFIARLHIYFI